jgi:hypothetical protein
MLRFRFAAQPESPALELFWYDGGMKPRLPEELDSQGVELPRSCILFVGDQGTIMAEFMGRNPRLFCNGKSEPLTLPDQPDVVPAGTAWLQAMKGQASPGSFLHAGPITDAVNLGTVALRAGTEVHFDSQKMQITNSTAANRYLVREYRKGWEM